MRARAFVILWACAAFAATTIAWQGVSIVDSQVISPGPAISTSRSSTAVIPIEPAPSATSAPTATAEPTTADEPEIELNLDLSALEEATPETEPTTDSTEPESDPSAASSPPTPRPTTPPQAARTPTPRPTEAPTAQQQPTETPTATQPSPSATPRPPEPTPQPSPTATAVPTQTITFDLIGGTASVSFAPNEVHVLWATPEPGFTADIGNSGPGQRVRFRSDDGESQLEVWWDAGPQWSIDEDHD